MTNVNETQGYVLNKATGELSAGYKWILLSDNSITIDEAKRDIFPIKRRVVVKETEDVAEVTALLDEANSEALKELTESMFQENIEVENIQATFETKFNIYVRRGEPLYKSLPCGELHYDGAGLKKVQIGYRITGIQFII